MDWNKIKEDTVNWAKETSNEIKEYRARDSQERKLRVTELKFMGQKNFILIRKDKDGNYYFSAKQDDDAEKYTFEGYEWAGANLTTHTKTKGKNKGRAGSSLVGGALLGPIGAIAGASRGKKHNSESVSEIKEKDTKAKLFFKRNNTGEIKEMTILNNSKKNAEIRAFLNE